MAYPSHVPPSLFWLFCTPVMGHKPLLVNTSSFSNLPSWEGDICCRRAEESLLNIIPPHTAKKKTPNTSKPSQCGPCWDLLQSQKPPHCWCSLPISPSPSLSSSFLLLTFLHVIPDFQVKKRMVNFSTLPYQSSQEARISEHNSHTNRIVGPSLFLLGDVKKRCGYRGTQGCVLRAPLHSGFLRWLHSLLDHYSGYFPRQCVSSRSMVPWFRPFGALALSISVVMVHAYEDTPVLLYLPDSVHHGPPPPADTMGILSRYFTLSWHLAVPFSFST